MLNKKKYSKKEILAFEGFTKLIDDGVSISSVKVSDIAKSAGIGKGTLYEYFESKDEIIAKSILYKMQMEFEGILEKSSNAVGFSEKCNVGFQEILEIMTKQFAYFQILITSKEIHHVLKCLNDGKDEMIEFRNYILEILDPVIDLGIEEGVINPSLDRVYIRSVFMSVGSGLSTIVRFHFGEFTKEEINIQKDIAYTILIKALK